MVKVLSRQLQCAALLVAEGMSASGGAACTGNFCRESGPTLPTAFRKAHLDHGSNGLAQWRGSRLDDYMDFVQAKHPEIVSADDNEAALWAQYGRLDYQCAFVAQEMRNAYPALWRKLLAGGDVASLTADVCWQYERPNRALSGIDLRISYAKAIAAAMPARKDDVVTSLATVAIAHDTHAANGGVIAGSSVALMSGIAMTHLVHFLHWFEIVAICCLIVGIVIGIGTLVFHAQQASAVRQAMTGADTTVPRGGVQSPIVAEPPPPMPPAAPLTVTPVMRAQQEERDAIDKAMAANEPPAAPVRQQLAKPMPPVAGTRTIQAATIQAARPSLAEQVGLVGRLGAAPGTSAPEVGEATMTIGKGNA